MRASRGKRHRRSWKNLLINKSYQLRFTFFMMAVTAVLMSGLGWWVMDEARKTTKVSISGIDGERCPEIPETVNLGSGQSRVIIQNIGDMVPIEPDAPAPNNGDNDGADNGDNDGADTGDAADTDSEAGAGDAPTPDNATDTPPPPAADADDGDDADDDGETAAAGEDRADGEREHAKVILDDPTMMLDPSVAPMVQTVPPELIKQIIAHYQCELDQAARIATKRAGYRRIFIVLISVGALLLIGLMIYSIKMTHKVAGPLHKVSLYFEKMRKDKYDTVYDLRRGDQLVEFYDQFKAAHKGVTEMEREDIAKLRAVIKAADAENLSERSPEIAAALDELREVLARKEASLD